MPLFPTQFDFWHVTSTEALLTQPTHHSTASPTLPDLLPPSSPLGEFISRHPLSWLSVKSFTFQQQGGKIREGKTGRRQTHLMSTVSSMLHHARVHNPTSAVCPRLRGWSLVCQRIWGELCRQLRQWDLSGSAGGWVSFIYPSVAILSPACLNRWLIVEKLCPWLTCLH